MLGYLQQYGPAFVSGTLTTCALFLCSAAVAIVVAMLAGLGRLSNSGVVRGASTGYIELFRGTSLLVQLYWIFFVLPLFGLTIPAFQAGVFSVGLNAGAYGAELVRGAIQAVPRGQWEAAYALSLSPSKRMRRIIMPQAIRIMLPLWGNLFIEVLKATALVSLLAVHELTFQAKQVNNFTFLSIQSFGTALIIYYVLARFFITPFMRWLERRISLRLGNP